MKAGDVTYRPCNESTVAVLGINEHLVTRLQYTSHLPKYLPHHRIESTIAGDTILVERGLYGDQAVGCVEQARLPCQKAEAVEIVDGNDIKITFNINSLWLNLPDECCH